MHQQMHQGFDDKSEILVHKMEKSAKRDQRLSLLVHASIQVYGHLELDVLLLHLLLATARHQQDF